MDNLDQRLNAYRPDLADERLRGIIDAPRYVTGKLMRVIAPVAALYKIPDRKSERQSECLFGEDVLVFETADKFCWVQSLQDGYVGYVEQVNLGDFQSTPTHIVIAPRSFQYENADLRSPMISALSIGSKVTIVGESETRATLYAKLDNGNYVIADHLAPIAHIISDYVSTAENLIHTPYLWGGKSGLGIDCSGLVQLSMMMAGKRVLRDTDMQVNTIGTDIDPSDGLQRGDLVFWKGHVAIMVDHQNIIHANGASMNVKIEPLEQAIARIARHYAQPTCYRRPD